MRTKGDIVKTSGINFASQLIDLKNMAKLNVVFKYIILFALIVFPKKVSSLKSISPSLIVSDTSFLQMSIKMINAKTMLRIVMKMKMNVDMFAKNVVVSI